ncbi:toll/interleukin-1 receptor domain-containing protein, partial [Rhodopirellula bahusiensis]
MARNVGLLFRNNSISKRRSKRKTKQRESFDYDAALSFSGKDRKLAGSIAREAKRLGLRIFYDRDNKAFMWGKSERVYHDVYGRQSRTVVPIVSVNYLDCEIARFEYDIAKQEAPNRDHEYILPVRCDGSLLPGLVGTTGYLSAEEYNARQIALLLKEKLSQLLDRDQPNCNGPVPFQHADERL